MNDYPVYRKCPLSRVSRRRFHWGDGNTSLNDNGIRIIKAHNLPYCYILQQLHVLINSHWCPVDYRKVPGEKDVWEMLIYHI